MIVDGGRSVPKKPNKEEDDYLKTLFDENKKLRLHNNALLDENKQLSDKLDKSKKEIAQLKLRQMNGVGGGVSSKVRENSTAVGDKDRGSFDIKQAPSDSIDFITSNTASNQSRQSGANFANNKPVAINNSLGNENAFELANKFKAR